MERQKKVVDASVGLKWFFEEENSDKAESLLNLHVNHGIILVVPELFFYEASNALRFGYKQEQEINKAVEDMELLQLHVEPYSLDIIKIAVKIALKYDLTIYDAVYVALAEKLNAKLITADEKIIKSKHPLVETLA